LVVIVADLIAWLEKQKQVGQQQAAEARAASDQQAYECHDRAALAYQNVINKLSK